jgi:putative flippase GtrA
MRQFIVFIGVGLTCAIIDVGLMQMLIFFNVHYVVAASTGFAAGFVANFLMHASVTFNAKYSHRVLGRFIIVVFVNYLLTILFVSFFHEWLDMAVLGKVLSLPLVAVNGFFLSKHWVFR